MKEQFVTYEIAKELKELGFNEECFFIYLINGESLLNSITSFGTTVIKNSDLSKSIRITAPLWQQATDWLGKHKLLSIELTSWYGVNKFWKFEIFKVGDNNRTNLFPILWSEDNDYHEQRGTSSTYTFEQAREQAILKAIQLCKKNK